MFMIIVIILLYYMITFSVSGNTINYVKYNREVSTTYKVKRLYGYKLEILKILMLMQDQIIIMLHTMKNKLQILFIILGIFGLYSCNNDDNSDVVANELEREMVLGKLRIVYNAK